MVAMVTNYWPAVHNNDFIPYEIVPADWLSISTQAKQRPEIDFKNRKLVSHISKYKYKR